MLALGRAVHEGAWATLTKDGRAVVVSGVSVVMGSLQKVSGGRLGPPGPRVATSFLLARA